MEQLSPVSIFKKNMKGQSRGCMIYYFNHLKESPNKISISAIASLFKLWHQSSLVFSGSSTISCGYKLLIFRQSISLWLQCTSSGLSSAWPSWRLWPHIHLQRLARQKKNLTSKFLNKNSVCKSETVTWNFFKITDKKTYSIDSPPYFARMALKRALRRPTVPPTALSLSASVVAKRQRWTRQDPRLSTSPLMTPYLNSRQPSSMRKSLVHQPTTLWAIPTVALSGSKIWPCFKWE